MKSVTVSAPGKLMLLGEHAVVYGYPCIVTAVNQRLRLTATIHDEPLLIINAPDMRIVDYKRPITMLGETETPKEVQFVAIAVKNFNEKYGLKTGISIATASEFKSTIGFGSSSASTVCVIKALSELFGKELTNKEIFDLSYKTVLDIQKKGSGFDVASAIFGKTLYFVTGGKTILPLAIDNFPIVVGYSGVKADTVRLINKVSLLFNENPKLVKDIYKDIGKIVEKAKTALEEKNCQVLGELMNLNQIHLAKLGVSTRKLDVMIHASRDAGAYGAKLSGAGGGDCMFAFAPENRMKIIEKAIKKSGGEIMQITSNAQGVRVEK